MPTRCAATGKASKRDGHLRAIAAHLRVPQLVHHGLRLPLRGREVLPQRRVRRSCRRWRLPHCDRWGAAFVGPCACAQARSPAWPSTCWAVCLARWGFKLHTVGCIEMSHSTPYRASSAFQALPICRLAWRPYACAPSAAANLLRTCRTYAILRHALDPRACDRKDDRARTGRAVLAGQVIQRVMEAVKAARRACAGRGSAVAAGRAGRRADGHAQLGQARRATAGCPRRCGVRAHAAGPAGLGHGRPRPCRAGCAMRRRLCAPPLAACRLAVGGRATRRALATGVLERGAGRGRCASGERLCARRRVREELGSACGRAGSVAARGMRAGVGVRVLVGAPAAPAWAGQRAARRPTAGPRTCRCSPRGGLRQRCRPLSSQLAAHSNQQLISTVTRTRRDCNRVHVPVALGPPVCGGSLCLDARLFCALNCSKLRVSALCKLTAE